MQEKLTLQVNNKNKGWQTYNNFECSFDWKIV